MESEKNNGEQSAADTSTERNVWFVCQGKSYKPGGGPDYLETRQQDGGGKTPSHWRNMTLVKKGDLIFNYYSGGIRAISRATSDNRESNDDSGEPIYRVDVEMFELNKPIDFERLHDKIELFKKYLVDVDGPFNRNDKIKEGYLFRFTKEAGKLVNEIYGDDFGEPDIDNFFTSDERMFPFSHPHRQELLAIKTKPFIILAGISGTGKSRLVRTLAYQTCFLKELQHDTRPGNFELIKIKPNWHDPTELMGYTSRINGATYIVPSFLKFIVKAWKYQQVPFFVCLDEMNLAPVEQYLSDYLSLIETRQLRKGIVFSDTLLKREDFESEEVYEKALQEMGVSGKDKLWRQFMNNGVTLPPNLVVIGTVNMDEVAHSFSRKVLDRAMTIEMNHVNLDDGLDSAVNQWNYVGLQITLVNVIGNVLSAGQVYNRFWERVIDYLKSINTVLDNTSFKIAYRVRDEFVVYCYHNSKLRDKPRGWIHQCLDELTCMKILPRIEGDYAKTHDVLEGLMRVVPETYKISQAKLQEMMRRLKSAGYTDYWA